MGIKKTTRRILKDNFWITQCFIQGKSDEAIADAIRKEADENESFENVIFELGVESLIKTGGKDFIRE